ncbi:DAK2 domain-containing protein [Clostridium sp. SYSU_GA19001]|uniref:DAK2 domain-containing protein n=1 Tax=Clostridium caldaquaticum TaxID=2940653 RepID=UPI00207708B2|nr:DAK2 domain-containing protein [Clostridium caldaquaticum]MCM8710581.1 DAK2 domain-containing protein [Clostridium caldaquaticum]
MEFFKINGIQFYNMVVNASNKLEEQKAFVNSLNVFPVPDGDTGTNMSMTFRAAVSEIKDMHNTSIGEVSKKVSRGALMGARGNSGVILSQIFRGIAKGLENKNEVDALEFANSLLEGSKAAYKAVMRPTEGTILTIVRAAGESAVKSSSTDITLLMKEVCEHSEAILNKTPEMLPVLKKAKVVDAGGMGLLIILKGMYEALKDNIQAKALNAVNAESYISNPASFIDEQDIKFGYCTEFFVLGNNINVESFRNELEPHGDSIIVVGVEDAVKVHIHTNDPGLALSKAVKLGELSKIKIDNMREQHRHILNDDYVLTEKENLESVSKEVVKEKKKFGIISVAMGEGIKNIFKDFGVDYVIEGGQTMNPSTQDMLNCINNINAENIFILPNNKNIVMTAKQAAELTDKNIVVIPANTIPQGISCVTVFDSEASLEENIAAMEEAIKNVITAQITYAVRDTEMDGKKISEGDILGLVEGKINEVGKDVYEVCETVINNITKESSELITIFFGQDVEENKVNLLVEKLEEKYPDKDIQSYNGKQPLYYFLIAVE